MNHVLDGVNVGVGRIHSQPRGATNLRCGLSSKFLNHLLIKHADKVFLQPVHVVSCCDAVTSETNSGDSDTDTDTDVT